MSIRSTKNGSTPIFYYSKVGASSLNVVNQSLDTIYELPKVAPTENGQVISVNTDGSSSFVSNDANPNAWINDQYGVSTTNKLIPFTDDTPNGLTYDPSFSYEVADNQNFLKVGAAQVISSNNNMKLDSTDYILTTKDFYLQGTEDVQRYLTIGRVNLSDNVKTYVDINTTDYICDNQLASKTQFKGASEYTFDSDVKIGDNTTSKKLYVNDVEITPSGAGVSAGMLRALSLNLIVPTVAQTYNVVWSNLTPEEQLLWKGGDAATADPIASATGNYWSFVKTSGTSKINWTPPIDLSSLSFQDLQSVWAIVRINTTTGNLATEGSLWFQIQSSNDPANPPAYRTRWNYSNAANPNSQTGYFIKLFALDTIPLSTSASNTGKGQESTQVKFKGNPCDVEPTLFSLGLNKFVVSPSGDISTSGYTLAPVQSVGINTASNILSYNFDVIAFGVNSYRWNLFFA
jgi:hypothetical protein